MSLRSASEFAFDELIRARGREDFRRGRVSVQERLPAKVRYAVRAEEVRNVELEHAVPQAELRMSCSCPHFLAVNFCRHIWSALCLADAQTHFPDLKDAANLRFSFGGALRGIEDADPSPGIGASPSAQSPSPVDVDHGSQPSWREALARSQSFGTPSVPASGLPQIPRAVFFAIDLPKSRTESRLCLRFLTREILKSGKFGASRLTELDQSAIHQFGDPGEREVLWDLLGRGDTASGFSSPSPRGSTGANLTPEHARVVLNRIQLINKLYLIERRTGGYFATRERVEARPFRFTDEPYEFKLQLKPFGPDYRLEGALSRASQVLPTGKQVAQVAGFVFTNTEVAPIEPPAAAGWINLLKTSTPLTVEHSEINEFLRDYFAKDSGVELELPTDLQFAELVDLPPRPRLVIRRAPRPGRLMGRVEFDYDGLSTPRHRSGDMLTDPVGRRRVRRDREVETRRIEDLKGLEPYLGPKANRERDHLDLSSEDLAPVADHLMAKGWEVRAFEKVLRPATHFEFKMEASGID